MAQRKAIVVGGQPVEVTGQDFVLDGVQHAARVLVDWPPAALAELGVVDIVEAAPPPFGMRRTGARLDLVDGEVVEALLVEEVPIGDLRASLFDAIGGLRWAHETGGIVVNGVAVATDDRTQAKLTGAVVLFREDPSLLEVRWKVRPGLFETIPRDPGLAQGVAVGRFVQACFAHEAVLTDAIIAAPDAAALAAIDITAGWPATTINEEP